MNDTAENVRYTVMSKITKVTRYNVSVFTNLIETKKEIYLSKRDFYAEANDDISMRYYDAKAEACKELLYTISLMF